MYEDTCFVQTHFVQGSPVMCVTCVCIQIHEDSVAEDCGSNQREVVCIVEVKIHTCNITETS